MSRHATKPVTTIEGDDAHRREVTRHPAFGVIKVTRCSGGAVRLFGSELVHHTTVHVEIHRATEQRSLHDSKHLDEGRIPLVSLDMSEAQWARFVSSTGIGAGTPCTFDMAPADDSRFEPVPEIAAPDETLHGKFRREAEEKARNAIEAVEKARALMAGLLSKPSVTKADLRAAMAALDNGCIHFASNVGYLQERLEKAMETIAQDAKTEVEAFVQSVAVATGIEALRNGAAPVMPMLRAPGQADTGAQP